MINVKELIGLLIKKKIFMYGERILFIYFIAREFVKIKWQNNMIPYGSFVILRPMLILFELTFVVIWKIL